MKDVLADIDWARPAPSVPMEINEIARLIDEGKTLSQMTEMFGWPANALSAKIKRELLPLRPELTQKMKDNVKNLPKDWRRSKPAVELAPLPKYEAPKVFENPPASWSSDSLDDLKLYDRKKKIPDEPEYNRRWKPAVPLKEYFDSRHRVHNWTDIPTAEEKEEEEIRSKELERAYAWALGNCKFAQSDSHTLSWLKSNCSFAA